MENQTNDKIQEAIEEAVKYFFTADSQVANTTCSRGGVLRAIRYAMHNNLTTKQIKLKDKQEEKLAFMFMMMLDNRTIMQAKLFSDLENKEKLEEKGENNG